MVSIGRIAGAIWTAARPAAAAADTAAAPAGVGMAEAVPAGGMGAAALAVGTAVPALVLGTAEAVQAADTVEAALPALLGTAEAALPVATAEAALPVVTAQAALPAATVEVALPVVTVEAALPVAMERAPAGTAANRRRRHLDLLQHTARRAMGGRADTARWGTARRRPLLAMRPRPRRRRQATTRGPSTRSSSRARGCQRPRGALRADTTRWLTLRLSDSLFTPGYVRCRFCRFRGGVGCGGGEGVEDSAAVPLCALAPGIEATRCSADATRATQAGAYGASQGAYAGYGDACERPTPIPTCCNALALEVVLPRASCRSQSRQHPAPS